MNRRVMGYGATALLALFGFVAVSRAQTAGPSGARGGAEDHGHIGPASGIPHGIPRICAAPTVASVASGAWSNPTTWSTRRTPAAGDLVRVAPGTAVSYDLMSDESIFCVDVEGTLRFRTDVNTRLTVGTLTVLESGRLEIGMTESPVAAAVTAELVIADRPIDLARDPEQLTGGLIGLGTIRIHGAPKEPTFLRVAEEPLAGRSNLVVEGPVPGWSVGDRLVLPDTRHLRDDERNSTSQWEELAIAAISGTNVTLASPLFFDHKGARRPDGVLEFLPHVGNLTRNVIIRSANPSGVRGHVIFVAHPDVDIRYALFKSLGRTKMGVLDSTEFGPDDSLRHVGTNQIGRYSLHFHHAFGPKTPQSNGHQFTVLGNAVDDASKWGITIHNSHYGLIRDNVVYNSRGAGIVAEDGTESFNVFEHNFALRSEGSGDFAPRSGYGGATNDPGGEGAGFWLRGPNNVVRNNVAANVDVFGYGIAAGNLGTVRIPRFMGANTSQEGEYVTLDTTDAPLLEFTGNEAYGAIQTGVAVGWNGTVKDVRVWHTSRHAVAAFPTDRLTIQDLIARGNATVLSKPLENPVGIWFTNYAAKTVTVRNADIQGMRVGVVSPFFSRPDTEPGRGDGVATIENSYFRSYVGVAVATAYTTLNARLKRATVRSTRFDTLDVPKGMYEPAAISMNYGMSRGDPQRRDPIVVYDFNQQPGNSFRVFYSLELPESAAPCAETRPNVQGFVCDGDGESQ